KGLIMNRESDFQVDAVDTPSSSSANILQVIWQRKGFVVLGALLGLAVGFLFHTQKSPVYASSSSLVIRKTGRVVQTDGKGGGIVEDYMATQGLVLRSELVVDAAVRDGNLGELESMRNAYPTGAIIAGLTASRDTKETQGAPNNILLVSYRGQ